MKVVNLPALPTGHRLGSRTTDDLEVDRPLQGWFGEAELRKCQFHLHQTLNDSKSSEWSEFFSP